MSGRSLSFAEVRFDFDYRQLERQLDGIARKALPSAGVVSAKAQDGAAMFAQVHVRDEQAKYLAFQILGGERGARDAGAGPYDVQPWAEKTTRFGGVDKRQLKRLSTQNKTEKAKRAELRAKRVPMRGAGQPTKAARWVTASRNRPGVFFGEVGGVKGYWERPKRTKAAVVRKRGIVTVRPSGDNRPKLRMMMKDSVTYKPIYRYDWYIKEAFRVKGSRTHWQKALDREVSKLSR
jgi:hypothetical protein